MYLKTTLQKKSNLSSILKDFSSGKINILIGTQMISKGLDFNDVDLVGVVNADYGMFIPDFRSGEKTFQKAKKLVLKTEVPALLIKQHKCETTAPEYNAIKKCVLTTIQDSSVFPAFFKAEIIFPGMAPT